MKKSTVTTFIFFTLLGFAKAQILKGTYTLRPSLSVSEFGGRVLGTSANNNPLSISMGMNYGKFVTDKLLISGGASGRWSNRVRNYPDFNAEFSTHYYYWAKSQFKPYVTGSLYFSRDNILQIVPNIIIVRDSVYHINQLYVSVGTGVQYFINENVALDARFVLTAYALTDKKSKQPYSSAYTLNLRPFYTSASYQSAKEINNFFYKGKIEISGKVLYIPKVISNSSPLGNSSLSRNSSLLSMSAAANYSLNKWLTVGVDLNYWKIANSNAIIRAGSNVGINLKLSKRLYLTPNVNLSWSKDIDLDIISEANIGAKYFINKNIAWTTTFFSFELYNTQTFFSRYENLFFYTGVTYYLK